MTRPIPEPTPVSQPFWDGLARHRILVQYSPSAQRYVFYPRTLTPGTLADDLQWREIDGAATLYTFTVARRPTGPPWADALPQLPAVVQWDAGPKFSTELVTSTRVTSASACGCGRCSTICPKRASPF